MPKQTINIFLSAEYHKGSTTLLEQPSSETSNTTQQVQVAAGALSLPGLLHIPDNARGLVVLAHGSNNIESPAHYDKLPAGLHQAGPPPLSLHLPPQEEQKTAKETPFFRF